jgi:putative transposase
VFLPNGRSSKRGLSRSLADVGLGEFFRQLKYKCAWRGVRLLKVGRWEPSSSCGEIKVDLTLAMRTWTCSSYSYGHRRDINTAINFTALAA